MQRNDVASLTGRLLWGTPATRRQLAEDLLGAEFQPSLALLADTVRSREAWLLRARCLEVLGMAAAQGGREVAEQILQLLVTPAPLPSAPPVPTSAP